MGGLWGVLFGLCYETEKRKTSRKTWKRPTDREKLETVRWNIPQLLVEANVFL